MVSIVECEMRLRYFTITILIYTSLREHPVFAALVSPAQRGGEKRQPEIRLLKQAIFIPEDFRPVRPLALQLMNRVTISKVKHQ